MRIIQNARKPVGFGGWLMLHKMNLGHAALSRWGIKHLTLQENFNILDIGCGGGANLNRLLNHCPQGFATGVDASPLSVRQSKRANKDWIREGRCLVLQGQAQSLFYPAGTFHLVTAFETVYFWPDILKCFRSIHQMLKPGGVFMICNESDGQQEKDRQWVQQIDGMTLYTPRELEELLRQAGFRDIRTDCNGKGWMCVLATKEI